MEIIQLKLSVTNCFLIKTENKYILIDTGYEYDWDLFCKRLKSVGVRLSDISHIILTHHHDDHCGLLNRILKENSSVQVVMSYLAKDLLLKLFICNIDEYYESWRKIISENCQRIFPAHGNPFSVEKLKINIGKNQKKDMVMKN
ncbi:MBL fold metallo-hydrolase [Clostridium sp. CM027]|uniref:MBL fold metallo-hydrolase n=1 Tax=Clostridium sp. CM027 TaxID=2849865 RepID=UPI001C6E067E|nr:MBL fold metallo-hydrolase [Clostridium sp. CM027]MBW9144683.1 MBL fold metallo-hydrolase [Clostridium sp. CM027]UVE40565.1 MBL fold metallo-hydrolase [Clostridium sp. CM027]